MRPTRLNARLPVVAALGAAIAATALVGPARAGDSDQPIDQRILHNILTGIGLQDPNAPQPEYRERSPLAIPKTDTLPPPGTPGAAVANNPAWPKDPDVERAKRLAKQRANEIRDPMEQMAHDKKPLMPDQLGPKYPDRRYAGRGYDASSADLKANHKMIALAAWLRRGAVRQHVWRRSQDQEAAQFTGEPARTSLTEPPPGYQTPSPTQPYGVGQEASKPKAEELLPEPRHRVDASVIQATGRLNSA